MSLTFHKIFSGCKAGDLNAWRAFVRDYSPLMTGMLAVYAPPASAEPQAVWRESLRALFSDSSLLRSLPQQSEREFLVELRVLVLTGAASSLKPEGDTREVAAPTFEGLISLLRGLPLLHQAFLLLKLAGYADRRVERLLRITPGMARAGLERLQSSYPAVLGRDTDGGLWPAGWLRLLHQAWSSKQEGCAPTRQLIRLLDGQTAWHDKEPAEKHSCECLHCLERWVALREIAFWQHEARPLAEEDTSRLLSGLPLAAVEPTSKPKRPLIKRIFE